MDDGETNFTLVGYRKRKGCDCTWKIKIWIEMTLNFEDGDEIFKFALILARCYL